MTRNMPDNIEGLLSSGQAADIGIFVKGRDKQGEDVVYMVTCVRKFPPHAGELALVGGVRDFSPHAFDSPMYTALEEAKQEAGLLFQLKKGTSIREEYDIAKLPLLVNTTIEIKDRDPDMACSHVYYVKTIATGDCEYDSRLDRKRVYTTSGYVLPIEMPIDKGIADGFITPERMARLFSVRDRVEIKELRFPDVTAAVLRNDLSQLPRFGMSHHNTMARLMIEKAGKAYRGEL